MHGESQLWKRAAPSGVQGAKRPLHQSNPIQSYLYCEKTADRTQLSSNIQKKTENEKI